MAHITTITPNPAVDVTYEIPDLRWGDVNRVATMHRRAGGKGLNVSSVARTLGADVTAVLPVGTNDETFFADELDRAGVAAELIVVDGATRRTTVIVTPEAHPTGLYESGDTLGADAWRDLCDRAAGSAASSDVAVVSGSLPSGVRPEDLAALISQLRSTGTVTIVDTSGPALLAAARAGASVLKPNLAELLDATGVADWRAGAAELLRLGAGTVVVSLGVEGLAYVTADDVWRAGRIRPIDGNPTGAGDAVVASVAVSLARQDSPADLARWAVCAGAAAVASPVAGEIDPITMQHHFLSMTITKERR